MSTYIVTGATGFLGRRVLERLLQREPDAVVHALVRSSSVPKVERLAADLDAGDRLLPLVGDLTEPGLGLTEDPPAADHVIHLGAVYDMTASADQSQAANVDGTRAVIDLALKLDATLHHVSSVAVAGDHRGIFTEGDFNVGQNLPSPYHETKFIAEKMVRGTPGLRWRVYRPAIVVGDSRTGEMDKIDGPYYFFTALRLLARLPALLPTLVPDIGATNVVPVDYVADAMVELVLGRGLDGQAFHLVNPRPQSTREIYGALAAAAGAPMAVGSIPSVVAEPALHAADLPGVKIARDLILDQLGVPPVVIDHLTFPSVFDSTRTQKLLSGSGITPPDFDTYAGRLYRYWYAHLDPNRARRPSGSGQLAGRHVMITGGSSGIGLATAHKAAARGAVLLLVARGAEDLQDAVDGIRADGGAAYGYPCDITDDESVASMVKKVLDEHDHVDFLVNNAGRSIRRGIVHSLDRMHDFERTMSVNYFGAVRLILALLPSMRERRFGHIVNISSIGVQTKVPRFAAYVASKAALDAFSDVISSETFDDGITFTSVKMPLVRTPMIAPTTIYQSMPTSSPDEAADMVIRAMEKRPVRIETPVGTIAEFTGLFAPRFRNLLLHQAYRLFPESSAAKGEKPVESASTPSDGGSGGRTALPAPQLPPTAKRIARLVPGIYW
ncbi:SDR family oxidoreductase [Williamsia sterculiae]|uniref:Thioester reductase domain-containing protein n=1 Tax=Williamsia sterculiae TaxID=1344003 RepID=A0A1N7F4Y6_9NOCA|nr:SDR family oxidoreductase [Williamsia sterculiae]SIR95384.1 Thioester reductase domain-containing protein [Williamsia sterculiae]